MDVRTVREKLVKVLETPEDDKKYQDFVNEYTMLLDETRITEDTANIAIEAINIDQGVNFLDTFAALEKKQVQDAWKVTRGCDGFRSNNGNSALKLI